MTQAETVKAKKSRLQTRFKNYWPQIKASVSKKQATTTTTSDGPLFKNPFKLEDLSVFDQATLHEMLHNSLQDLPVRELAISFQDADSQLSQRIWQSLSYRQRSQFKRQWQHPASASEVATARQHLLDKLFWELTYWKTPELYEELTSGEDLHPGIFQKLGPQLRGKIVLDAGAGSGRASFECVRKGAKTVYALEPSQGLLNILEEKLANQPELGRIVPCRGRFDALPLENNSVDVALSCSAFTAEAGQGGEQGLAEMMRVTKPGGRIVIIWPRPEDYDWLAERGFKYVALPLQQEMQVRFPSLKAAVRCARRFYARNPQVLNYLLKQRSRNVPFSVLGFNPPRDYCWQKVEK